MKKRWERTKPEIDFKKNREFLDNPINLEKLREFNNKLIKIQSDLLTEIKKVNEIALKRLIDKKDWVKDFETQISISLYFDEKHPEYENYLKENEDDPLLVTFEMYMSPDKENGKNNDIEEDNCYYFLDPSVNHNDFNIDPNHPMNKDFHCYLFHHIYDHLIGDDELDWETILKIGTVWTDIEVIYQHFYEI